MFENAKEVNGVTVITALFSGTSSTGLRNMCDKVKENRSDIVAVFAGTDNGKATIAAVVGKEAMAKGAHAGKIVKQVAQIAGGNGGGKPDSAMAGAKDLNMLDEALSAVENIVSEMIKE